MLLQPAQGARPNSRIYHNQKQKDRGGERERIDKKEGGEGEPGRGETVMSQTQGDEQKKMKNERGKRWKRRRERTRSDWIHTPPK